MLKNALYAQSGGVTSVINATAAGVIEQVRNHQDKIGTLYAAKNGILGVLRENLFDMSIESNEEIRALTQTPGGAFGSCRFKLKDTTEQAAEYKRLFDVFEAHNIGYFFYNGGNDSADTCLKVAQMAQQLGYPLQAIHVPKTIDNDLPITHCCPGFGSVAKYVAVSTMEASRDIASMAETSTKVFIMEVMGRHAGWIAGSAGVIADNESDAPHIILLPEVAFDKQKFLAKVDESVKQQGYCVIVASEGAQYADGTFLADSDTVDAFGHKQLGGVAPILAAIVKDNLGYKYHWSVLDYLQRSARHLSSQVDLDQAYQVGVEAVNYAIQGLDAVMPAIKVTSQQPFEWTIEPANLSEVANVEKMMPAEFIRADGMGITQAGKDYFLPLIQGEAANKYSNGLPVYADLKLQRIEKKLKDPPVSG